MKRFILFLLIISIAGCNVLDFSRTVKFEVFSTASSVNVKYSLFEGGFMEIYDIELPWSETFDIEKGDYVYISGRIIDDSGSITATIYIDGKIYKTATRDGVNAIATVNGYLD